MLILARRIEHALVAVDRPKCQMPANPSSIIAHVDASGTGRMQFRRKLHLQVEPSAYLQIPASFFFFSPLSQYKLQLL